MEPPDPGVARDDFLDRQSPTDQARILRRCEKDGPGLTDPDWLIAEAAHSAANRIEKAVSASTDEMKQMVKTLVSMMEERQSEPPPIATVLDPLRTPEGKKEPEALLSASDSQEIVNPGIVNESSTVATKRTPRMYPTLRRLLQLRERVRVAASRTISAYSLGIIAIAVVALLSWFGGAAVTEARMRYANTAVATLLTTPAGHAAWRLLEMNGDGLPANLSRCRPYVEHGRKAMTCELWAQSAGGVLHHDTPLDLAWERVNDLPAWPFLAIAIAALTTLILRREKAKQPVRVR